MTQRPLESPPVDGALDGHRIRARQLFISWSHMDREWVERLQTMNRRRCAASELPELLGAAEEEGLCILPRGGIDNTSIGHLGAGCFPECRSHAWISSTASPASRSAVARATSMVASEPLERRHTARWRASPARNGAALASQSLAPSSPIGADHPGRDRSDPLLRAAAAAVAAAAQVRPRRNGPR
jgi:hypothetical protein